MDVSAQKMDRKQMKRANRQLVFTEIHCQGAVSRTALARQTGLSSMSVGRIADDLMQSGLVKECGAEENGGAGRKPRLLQIASDRLLGLGLELDRARLAAGVVDFNGRVVHRLVAECDLSRHTPEETARLAADLLARVVREQGVNKPFRVCGVACPGIIESETGLVRQSSQLGWRDVPFAQLLRRAAGFDCVAADNELKARGRAEVLFGEKRLQGQRVAMLNFGSGVGSALVVRRQIYRGRSNLAGELGHVCINPNGGLCECGRRGCLQTYLSDLSLLRAAQKISPGMTLEGLFEACTRHEGWAERVVGEMVEHAYIAIGILVNLYAPDTVILCGSLLERFPLLEAALQNDCRAHLNELAAEGLTVKTSTLGENGNLIGACTLAFYQELDLFEAMSL